MFFVCRLKILHKHCLQFLLGVKIAPREEHYGMLWYFPEWSIALPTGTAFTAYKHQPIHDDAQAMTLEH